MPDEPTLGEIRRVVENLGKELSGDIAQLDQRLSMYVLKEVYDAHRTSDLERIKALETAQTEQRAQTRTALLTAVTSFIAPIVVAVILAFILRGG
ncbi:hypothetical protein [Nocardiopsis alba]